MVKSFTYFSALTFDFKNQFSKATFNKREHHLFEFKRILYLFDKNFGDLRSAAAPISLAKSTALVFQS